MSADPAEPRAATPTRLVDVTDEYLDGIQMLTVREPDEYTGPTARRVPVSVVDAYENAWATLRATEKVLQAAWNAATEEPNPKHVEELSDAD